MTDLISTPSSAVDDAPLTPAPRVEWTPAPPRKRRRWPLALWIGIPVLALAGIGVFFGTILIAPGVTIAGVPVGGLTVGAATEKVSQTVSDTAVEESVAGIRVVKGFGAESWTPLNPRPPSPTRSPPTGWTP